MLHRHLGKPCRRTGSGGLRSPPPPHSMQLPGIMHTDFYNRTYQLSHSCTVITVQSRGVAGCQAQNHRRAAPAWSLGALQLGVWE
jgi:hypothetical protein